MRYGDRFVETLIDSVGEIYASTVRKLGLKPNHLTIIGLILSIIAPIIASTGNILAVILVVAVSALADALDGYTARTLRLTSRWGAFLDSTSDRIADAMYIMSLMILGINPVICFLLLTSSFLISYTRARGEALGLTLKGVGLVERQERVVFIIAILALLAYDARYAEVATLLLLILSIVTVVQRIAHIREGLRHEL